MTSLVCVDVYNVSAGDTLYSIAEKYDLPVSLLMKVNHIQNPYNLQVNSKLCIPGTKEQMNKPLPEVQYHVVEKGDTLYLIAKKHNVKLEEIIRANPDVDPYNMFIGTKLIIPS